MTLLVTLLLLLKVFIKEILEVSVLSVSNHWELNQYNFIYLLWLTVGKSSFLQNILEEIRPGSRNLQKGPK